VIRPYSTQKTSKYNATLEEKSLYAGGFSIGKDANVQKEESRTAAKHLMNQVRLDISDKHEVKNLRQQQEEKPQEGDGSGGFRIGADEESARAAQKNAQRLYYAQLVADKRSAPIDLDQLLTDSAEEDDIQYLNRTGWTGLQIGGQSSDGTKSMQHLHATQKLAKQIEYRQALYDQQTLHAQIERDAKFAVIGDFSAKSVPYMR
jgi:hypothetical protein